MRLKDVSDRDSPHILFNYLVIAKTYMKNSGKFFFPLSSSWFEIHSFPSIKTGLARNMG